MSAYLFELGAQPLPSYPPQVPNVGDTESPRQPDGRPNECGLSRLLDPQKQAAVPTRAECDRPGGNRFASPPRRGV